MNTRHSGSAAVQAAAIAAVLAAVVGAALGYAYALRQDAGPPAEHKIATPAAQPGERRILYWYDPMVPAQHFDKPGRSPFMDMDLVPKYADETGGAAAGVGVDPRLAQSLGMRLAPVTRVRFAPRLDAAATVLLNDRDVAILQARSAGFVERVHARAPGDVIAAGAALAEVLMPEWAGAQQEYLAVRAAGDAGLAAAARQRLVLLGMPADLIARVEREQTVISTTTLVAPAAGVIQELNLRAGMTIAPGMTLVRITGLATVWLEAAVPEAQAALVAPGRAAQARFAAFPGEVFVGKVDAVLPEANRETRTLRVRLVFANPGLRLRPGLYAQVALEGAAEEALVVPSEAVIRTGRRTLVFVAEDGGRYRPVTVETGREADGRVAVHAGLQEGQQVVASGQFLVDSEASLAGIAAAAPQAPIVEAVGTVVEAGAGEIMLAHEAIPALGWGAMTMAFGTGGAGAQVAALKPGQRVRFSFHRTEDGYVLDAIARVPAGSRP